MFVSMYTLYMYLWKINYLLTYCLYYSESGSSLRGKVAPTPCHSPMTNLLPLSPSRSHSRYLPSSPSCPTLGSEAGPGFRPFSRAAQEIMEICSVDHTGCEDPDLESDTTTHILEQELMATGTETHKSCDQHITMIMIITTTHCCFVVNNNSV